MRKMTCTVCGWIYNWEKGAPEEDVPAGTTWKDVPACFNCPECGAEKAAFKPLD